jgi:hypothetical protein
LRISEAANLGGTTLIWQQEPCGSSAKETKSGYSTFGRNGEKKESQVLKEKRREYYEPGEWSTWVDVALGGTLPIERLGEAKEKQGDQSKTAVERKKDTRASWRFAGLTTRKA